MIVPAAGPDTARSNEQSAPSTRTDLNGKGSARRLDVGEAPGTSEHAVTRILLVDDEPIMGAGLRAVLDAQQDLRIVGEEHDIPAAVVALPRSQPNVIVLGIHAAEDATFGAIRGLREGSPRAGVLLVSGEEDTATALRAIAAGARAVLPTRVPTNLMVQVVRTVAAGGLVLPARVGEELVSELVSELDQRAAVLRLLSERERRVLELLADGCSNTEIGGELFISEATVKKHVSQILRKLRRRDRLQAALYARELGFGGTAGAGATA